MTLHRLAPLESHRPEAALFWQALTTEALEQHRGHDTIVIARNSPHDRSAGATLLDAPLGLVGSSSP